MQGRSDLGRPLDARTTRLKLSLLISQFFNEKGFFGHDELDVDLADRITSSLPNLLSYPD